MDVEEVVSQCLSMSRQNVNDDKDVVECGFAYPLNDEWGSYWRSFMAGQLAVSATAKTKAAPSTGLPSFRINLGIAWWGSVYGVVVAVMVVAIAVLIVLEVVDDLG